MDNSKAVDQIKSTLHEDAPVVIGTAVTKSGFYQELDLFLSLSSDAKEALLSIQQREIEATGIPSLKIAYNNVFGYYLEVEIQKKIKCLKNG